MWVAARRGKEGRFLLPRTTPSVQGCSPFDIWLVGPVSLLPRAQPDTGVGGWAGGLSPATIFSPLSRSSWQSFRSSAHKGGRARGSPANHSRGGQSRAGEGQGPREVKTPTSLERIRALFRLRIFLLAWAAVAVSFRPLFGGFYFSHWDGGRGRGRGGRERQAWLFLAARRGKEKKGQEEIFFFSRAGR